MNRNIKKRHWSGGLFPCLVLNILNIILYFIFLPSFSFSSSRATLQRSLLCDSLKYFFNQFYQKFRWPITASPATVYRDFERDIFNFVRSTNLLFKVSEEALPFLNEKERVDGIRNFYTSETKQPQSQICQLFQTSWVQTSIRNLEKLRQGP